MLRQDAAPPLPNSFLEPHNAYNSLSTVSEPEANAAIPQYLQAKNRQTTDDASDGTSEGAAVTIAMGEGHDDRRRTIVIGRKAPPKNLDVRVLGDLEISLDEIAAVRYTFSKVFDDARGH